ncbi:unnamed protein product [Rhodiola kirilowii]
MDEHDNRRQRRRVETLANNGEENPEEDVGEEGDPAVWRALDKKLIEAQSILDRNRVLIQQVNDNHQSKISENMTKNVALIREINDNVSRVVGMYSDLGAQLSGALHHHRRGDDTAN